MSGRTDASLGLFPHPLILPVPFSHRGIFAPVTHTPRRSSVEPCPHSALTRVAQATASLPPSPSCSGVAASPARARALIQAATPGDPLPLLRPATPGLNSGVGMGETPEAAPARAHSSGAAASLARARGVAPVHAFHPLPISDPPSDPVATMVGSILLLSGQQLWIRASGRWSRTGHSSEQCFAFESACCKRLF
jgi:hypothetical protein